MDTEPYRPREAAKILGLSVDMLRYHREHGHIVGTPYGREWRYTHEQLGCHQIAEHRASPKLQATLDRKAAEKKAAQDAEWEEMRRLDIDLYGDLG